MPDASNIQVGGIYTELLQASDGLSVFKISFLESADVAHEEEDGNSIKVYCSNWAFDIAFENASTRHEVDFDAEIVTRAPAPGALSANASAAIGHIIAAIAVDRTLGGVLESIEEQDVSGVAANGLDANSVSLRVRAVYYTSRDDWFVIVPPNPS